MIARIGSGENGSPTARQHLAERHHDALGRFLDVGRGDDQRHHHRQADQIEHAGDERADHDQRAMAAAAPAAAPGGWRPTHLRSRLRQRTGSGRGACGPPGWRLAPSDRAGALIRGAADSSRSACRPRHRSRPAPAVNAEQAARRAGSRFQPSGSSSRALPSLRQLDQARRRTCSRGRWARASMHARAAAQKAAPQDAAERHPVRLPGAVPRPMRSRTA